jgi:hypothetical protein
VVEKAEFAFSEYSVLDKTDKMCCTIM